jgi:hypothetical protein
MAIKTARWLLVEGKHVNKRIHWCDKGTDIGVNVGKGMLVWWLVDMLEFLARVDLSMNVACKPKRTHIRPSVGFRLWHLEMYIRIAG